MEQKQQIERSKIAARYLSETKEMYVHLAETLDQVWVENFPRMWRLNLAEKEKPVDDDELEVEKMEWISHLPAVYWTNRIRPEVMKSFGHGEIKYDLGLMCYENDALALGMKRTKNVEVISGGDYLVTIYAQSERGPFTWENLSALANYLREKNINIYGDTFSHIMLSKTVQGTVTNYHRALLKIYS